MPKYLFVSSLTQEGVRGTFNEGGTARREAIRRAAEGLGGTLEALYYAFGDDDLYTIVDLPDGTVALSDPMIIRQENLSSPYDPWPLSARSDAPRNRVMVAERTSAAKFTAP